MVRLILDHARHILTEYDVGEEGIIASAMYTVRLIGCVYNLKGSVVSNVQTKISGTGNKKRTYIPVFAASTSLHANSPMWCP